MATYTNTLNSHHGESRTSREDKMSGWITEWKRKWGKSGTSMKSAKIISNRKRRMFLKNKKIGQKYEII